VITLDFNYTLMNTTNYNWINWFSEINHLSNTQMLGQILYTYYYLFFLIAGFILFIALVGSLMLTVTLNKSYKIN
jgi:NADH-ubiquinone oxidoreductase chain 6